MLNVLPQLAFTMTEHVRAAVADIGRTEDLRFSPDGRLLIIAGFIKRRCLVLRVQIEPAAGGPKIMLDDFMELSSDGISNVHGIDFIDNQTLALANRDGRATIVPLPSGELGGRQCYVKALGEVRSVPFCRVKAPGSLAVQRGPDGEVAILVCNNYIHRVTRHVVDVERGFGITKNQVYLRRSLKIPDGIAISHDDRWIAVSSHHSNDVKVFSTTARLGRLAKPAGILRDANFPHGLRFTADDRYLLVADAGSPVINVYARGDSWSGPHDPVSSRAVLDEATYLRGQINIEEGGPKGLDIDRSQSVVAVTCDEQALAFYSLADLTGERLS